MTLTVINAAGMCQNSIDGLGMKNVVPNTEKQMGNKEPTAPNYLVYVKAPNFEKMLVPNHKNYEITREQYAKIKSDLDGLFIRLFNNTVANEKREFFAKESFRYCMELQKKINKIENTDDISVIVLNSIFGLLERSEFRFMRILGRCKGDGLDKLFVSPTYEKYNHFYPTKDIDKNDAESEKENINLHRGIIFNLLPYMYYSNFNPIGKQFIDIASVLLNETKEPNPDDIYTNKSKVRISIFLKIGCFYIFYCKFYSPAESFTFFS